MLSHRYSFFDRHKEQLTVFLCYLKINCLSFFAIVIQEWVRFRQNFNKSFPEITRNRTLTAVRNKFEVSNANVSITKFSPIFLFFDSSKKIGMISARNNPILIRLLILQNFARILQGKPQSYKNLTR